MEQTAKCIPLFILVEFGDPKSKHFALNYKKAKYLVKIVVTLST